MQEEGFFRRWARLKAEGPAAPPPAPDAQPNLPAVAQLAPHPAVTPAPAADAPARALPTLDDVALLSADSDFSGFVTQGVDKNVQRLAMKKLFSDPHFNRMDGLDIYIDDYNKPDPVSATMLAALHHSKSFFAQAMKDEPETRDGNAPPPNDEPETGPQQSPQGDE
jgi:hypothetical protein